MHLPHGVGPVEVVGVYYGERLVYGVFRAQDGMGGAVGFGPPFGNSKEFRERGKVLENVFDFHGFARAGLLRCDLSLAERVHQFDHVRFYYKDDAVEARPYRVVYGVFHEDLAVRAQPVGLLAAAVA